MSRKYNGAMEHQDDALVVADICRLLLDGYQVQARDIASRLLPFVPRPKKKRQRRASDATPEQKEGGAKRTVSNSIKLEAWQRDGFRSRLSRKRLIFPYALELLSLILPDELPYPNPPNGPYDRTHRIMWELWPAVDHVIPVSNSTDTAIANSLDNLITLSSLENLEKWSFDLGYLGWTLLPPELLPEWDGLVSWYIQYLDQDPSWFDHPTSGRKLKDWHLRLARG